MTAVGTTGTTATTGAPPWPRLEAATAHLDPPFAVIDVEALHANADDLLRRAAGKPIRLASKSPAFSGTPWPRRTGWPRSSTTS